ncbi:hypothetical protein LZ32DRAFT_286293 [Colletotrichum eremochloae]|nr:hypothetical protein LZ32DRAFT_286293 [Colletotrichum eremochloae]
MICMCYPAGPFPLSLDDGAVIGDDVPRNAHFVYSCFRRGVSFSNVQKAITRTAVLRVGVEAAIARPGLFSSLLCCRLLFPHPAIPPPGRRLYSCFLLLAMPFGSSREHSSLLPPRAPRQPRDTRSRHRPEEVDGERNTECLLVVAIAARCDLRTAVGQRMVYLLLRSLDGISSTHHQSLVCAS